MTHLAPDSLAPRRPRHHKLLAGGLALALGGLLAAIPLEAAAATPRPADSAGALEIGQARYDVPIGAIFAAPNGNDAAAGTQASPVRTLARALAITPSDGTVVLRGGEYHEYVIITKPVTVQNYPGEAVWLDGSQPVTGWVADGDLWRKDGWTTRFDASPTYVKGAADSGVTDWTFINQKAAPMAAHPDQVFIGGNELLQVKDKASVKPGKFYLNEATSQLFVGSNPGDSARATTIAQAISARADRVTLRGFGVRHYGTSVWQVATVVMERPGATVENVRITDSATTNLSVIGTGATISKVTLDHAGMLGLHARFADGLRIDRLDTYANNREKFNTAPVSGGAKFGQTRGIRVTNSRFHDNTGPGFWPEMSCYDINLAGNDFTDNSTYGLFLEIDAKVIVANNLFANNGSDGIKLNNTSDVKIWNNTFVGNGRPLDIVQDNRRNTNPYDQAVDRRQPWPDPTMTWQNRDITISNNVIARPNSSANGQLAVEDYSHKDTAEQMRIVSNGNLYHRLTATSPSWQVIWSRGTEANPSVFTSLAAFRTKTGQEQRGVEYTTKDAITTPDGGLSKGVDAATIALPLPADVAALAGKPAGTKSLGAWSLDSTGTVADPPSPKPSPSTTAPEPEPTPAATPTRTASATPSASSAPSISSAPAAPPTPPATASPSAPVTPSEMPGAPGATPTPSASATPTAPTPTATTTQPAVVSPPSLTFAVNSVTDPRQGRQLLTPYASELTGAASYGFTEGAAQRGKAARQAAAGLTAIWRTYNGSTHEFRWVPDGQPLAPGFATQKVEFYAPTTASPAAIAVYRLTNGPRERLAFGDSELGALKAAGWSGGTVLFYLGR